MAIVLNILIIAACGVILWIGASQVVHGAGGIAHRFKISELVIGLTVVAFGTSAPELAVTVIAAIKGHGDISVGNVIGSNVINFGFVLGAVAVVRTIKTSGAIIKRDGPILVGITLLLIVFLYSGHLSHWEGVVFLFLLAVYNIYLFRFSKSEYRPDTSYQFSYWDIVRFIVGLVAITIASNYLVDSAVKLAKAAGISNWAIGQTVVAFGTSLPELATSVVAVRKSRLEMSAGNLIGSNIFNILGILGISSVIKTITIEAAAYEDLYLLLGFTVLVIVMMWTGRKLSRIEGGILIMLNLLIWVIALAGFKIPLF
jgi:cation:H+ antiporter